MGVPGPSDRELYESWEGPTTSIRFLSITRMDALERGTPTIQQVGSVPNRTFSEQCRVSTPTHRPVYLVLRYALALFFGS
ncbi:hypothetical protein SAMN05192552_10045 [Natrinema hispanicum]|uniref:Uncharacterized protein n=1 Tax=Natrinema hispanicum TaxID=392421 RepID=A0A1G6LJ38_9EURY|nr:hypothetical protein SAMN05192552_10045 [Natrinema hispanicum]SET22803.1 hypothetical protein SAMN04488694_104297 [Natrinema hispanicum]